MASYTVKYGDSLALIAQKVYGTGRMMQALSDYNGGIISLKPGDVLDLPEMQDNLVITDNFIMRANAADVSGRQMALSTGAYVNTGAQAAKSATQAANPTNSANPVPAQDWSWLNLMSGGNPVTWNGQPIPGGSPSSGDALTVSRTGKVVYEARPAIQQLDVSFDGVAVAQPQAPARASLRPGRTFSLSTQDEQRPAASVIVPPAIYRAAQADKALQAQRAEAQVRLDKIFAQTADEIGLAISNAAYLESNGQDPTPYMPKIVTGTVATQLYGNIANIEMEANGYVYNPLIHVYEFRGIPGEAANIDGTWSAATQNGAVNTETGTRYIPYYNNLRPMDGESSSGYGITNTYNQYSSSGRWNAADSALSTRMATG